MIHFIHIPKTAGTSFKHVVKSNSKHVALMFDRKKWKEQDESHLSPSTEVIYGHFELGFTSTLDTSPKYCTILRDPIERVISSYKHTLRSNEEKHAAIAASLNDITDFLEFDQANNLQTRLIAGYRDATFVKSNPEKALAKAKLNLNEFLCFGLTERYNETLLLFSEALNWWRLPQVQVNQGSKGITSESISDEVRNLIIEHNSLDIELYSYAEEIFDKNLKLIKHLPLKKQILKMGYGLGPLY